MVLKTKGKRKKSERKVPKKNFSLSEQAFSMKERYPDFSRVLESGKLILTGSIKPTPLSVSYEIKIMYEKKGTPKVWVTSPKLERYNNEKIPHMYNQKRLCLFYPKAKEWNRTMWISQTIIPWTSLWLYYYEIWLITGKWLGGGIHISPREGEKEDVQDIIN
jgi:hypothetical protein